MRSGKKALVSWPDYWVAGNNPKKQSSYMSRFYEALKQASRSLHTERENAEPDQFDFSAILRGAEAPGIAEPALPGDEIPETPAEQLVQSGAFPLNGSLGVTTEAVFDKKARVIPNAVELMVVEHYRLLRTSVMQQQAEKAFRSLLITSAGPKEGKTVTTLNLALTCAMISSYKVIVVDGDIRRGHMSRWLGVDDRTGLSNLFDRSAKLDEVVLKSAEIPFHFMGRGSSKLPAPELLHTGLQLNYLDKISKHFDLVLVDSPPVSLVADPQLLAGFCDAVLFVARAFHTSRTALQKLARDFQQYRVIGTVLNGGSSVGNYRRYRSYYPKA